MLKLDNRKLRKGKAYGIGYIGSKRKIAKRIYGLFSQNYNIENKPFYDIFGGGGAVSAEFAFHGHNVVHNDLDKNISESFKNVLNSEKDDLKKYCIPKSEFVELQAKLKEKSLTSDEFMKLLMCSFGNTMRTYVYSIAEHEERYRRDQVALSSSSWETDFPGTYDGGKKHELHSRLKQLYRTSQLPNKQLITFENKDFNAFKGVKDAVIYLDPPYRNTTSYYIGKFDHDSFYDFAVELSKNNIVLISEYEIADPRFEMVYSFDGVGSTLSRYEISNSSKHEKIYRVKEEYLNRQ